MFLNCGQLTPFEGSVRLEIWDGGETFEFRLAVRDVSALLQERADRIPISRMFGIYETKGYGRARLSNPDPDDGKQKGVLFLVPCLSRRVFVTSRVGLAGVARSACKGAGDRWPDAIVSELIPDPVPQRGTIRMGVVR